MDMEPTTTVASGFAISKLWAAAGGLFGGLMVSAFWVPAKLREYGKFGAAGIAGGIAVGSAITMGAWVAQRLYMDSNDPNDMLFVGVWVGALAVFVLNALANFFKKHEQKDIQQVVAEVKKSTPAKTSAKRVVRKVRAIK